MHLFQNHRNMYALKIHKQTTLMKWKNLKVFNYIDISVMRELYSLLYHTNELVFRIFSTRVYSALFCQFEILTIRGCPKIA